MNVLRPTSHRMKVAKFLGLLLFGWSATALAEDAAVTSPPSVLLYGFEPYAEVDVNPTGAYVAQLASGHPERRAAVLSVSPPAAMGELFDLMEEAPDVIIGFGVRTDVAGIEVNTAATNWISMRTEGELPYFGELEPGLPSAVGIREPWRREVEATIKASGVVATLSPDAGLHACNLTFFQALIHAAPEARVLFIHVAPELLSRPGLEAQLTRLVNALLSP